VCAHNTNLKKEAVDVRNNYFSDVLLVVYEVKCQEIGGLWSSLPLSFSFWAFWFCCSKGLRGVFGLN
jgi:hypothetical protein